MRPDRQEVPEFGAFARVRRRAGEARAAVVFLWVDFFLAGRDVDGRVVSEVLGWRRLLTFVSWRVSCCLARHDQIATGVFLYTTRVRGCAPRDRRRRAIIRSRRLGAV